jgi:hypothetical protein
VVSFSWWRPSLCAKPLAMRLSHCSGVSTAARPAGRDRDLPLSTSPHRSNTAARLPDTRITCPPTSCRTLTTQANEAREPDSPEHPGPDEGWGNNNHPSCLRGLASSLDRSRTAAGLPWKTSRCQPLVADGRLPPARTAHAAGASQPDHEAGVLTIGTLVVGIRAVRVLGVFRCPRKRRKLNGLLEYGPHDSDSFLLMKKHGPPGSAHCQRASRVSARETRPRRQAWPVTQKGGS